MGSRDKPPSYDDGDMGLDLDEDEDLGSNNKSESPSLKKKKETSSPIRPPSAKQSPSRIATPPKPSLKASTPTKIAKPPAKIGRSPSQSSLKQTNQKNSSQKDFDDELDYDDEDELVKTKIKAAQDKNQEVERLEQLTQQLLQQLEEKDKQLTQILQDINLDDVDELTDSAAKVKIASLAKKNKNLSLALEKEKTKNAKLQAENVNQPAPPGKPGSTNSKPAPPTSSFSKPVNVKPPQLQTSPSISSSSSSDDKELQELREANAKLIRQLSDAKDKVQLTQNENKNLRRVLQREVGENVDLNKVIEDSSGNWKGRAQQIAVLKAKISELSSVSDNKQKSPSIDNAHREEIAQIAADRRQEFDKLVQENEDLKEEFQKQKLKIEAKESRIKILEGKTHDLQEKIKIVLDKSKDDDQLVALLQKEVSKYKAKAGVV